MFIRLLVLSGLLSLAGCGHSPPRNFPDSSPVVAHEFELTRDNGSRVTWSSGAYAKEPFVESTTPTEFSVWTNPIGAKSFISISIRRVSLGTFTSSEIPRSTLQLPRVSYLEQKCLAAFAAPCEVREGSKLVASIRRIK